LKLFGQLGLYGLAAAKQYRFANPDDSLVIYDSQSSLGGIWAAERLYPDLKTNNLLGTYEYPDFPMDPETVKLRPAKDYIPGSTVHDYLTAYATNFGISGMVQFDTKVTVAEHQDTEAGGWILTAFNKQGEFKVFARRLIISTGLCSEPYVPTFKGQDTYDGKIFHGKYFQQNRDTLDTAKHATVFGGSKFAWDAVYSYAKAGAHVDWVIRGMPIPALAQLGRQFY
jgi:cation diffusion facilitator CzcD-associated flavoprotein CzcO